MAVPAKSLKMRIMETPGTEEWSRKVRSQAKLLAKTIDRGYMQLAKLVYDVWSTPIDGNPEKACICVKWGYQTYIEWAESELGINARTAQRLRSIWGYVSDNFLGKVSDSSFNRFTDLGQTKVRELIRVATVDNLEEWLDVAEHTSHEKLVAIIRHALKEAGKTSSSSEDDDEIDEPVNVRPSFGRALPPDYKEFKCRSFAFTPEQRSNVKSAIEMASLMTESKKEGHLLDLICTDFIATNDFRKRAASDIDIQNRFIAKYEALLGKKIVIVNPKENTVEYGIKTLEDLAEAINGSSD